MAISYLSSPIRSSVIPMQQPIELIASVAAEKQNKYDNVLSSVLAQYTNILNLDTSASDAVTNRYNQKMNEASKELESVLKLDLMNPDNYTKVENVFNPILQDTDIMNAVAMTKVNQKYKATMDYWKTKKPDLYNAQNDMFMQQKMQENKLMSLEDFNTKANVITPIEYVDRDKYVIDLLKGTDLEVTNSVTMPSGKHYITKSGRTITEADIKALFPTNSKYMQQTMVDAYFNYANTSDKEMLEEFDSNYKSVINNYRETNSVLAQSLQQLTSDIKNVEADTDTDKIIKKYGFEPEYTTKEDILAHLKDNLSKTQKSYKDNEIKTAELYSQRTSFFDKYGIESPDFETILSFSPLSKAQRESLGSQLLYNSDANRFAQAFSKEGTTIEIKENPDWTAERNHQYKMKEMQTQAIIDVIKEDAKNNSDNSSTNPTNPNAPASSGIFTEVGFEENKENKDKMDINKYNQTIADLQSRRKSVYDTYLSLQTPVGTTLNKTQRKQISDKYDAAKSLYNQFLAIPDRKDETTIQVGTAQMSFGDFKKTYQKEIAVIDEESQIDASLNLYTQFYSELKNYATQQYDIENPSIQEPVYERHRTSLLPSVNKKGVFPIAETFNSPLTQLDGDVANWLSKRMTGESKDVPLTDKELKYLFYNGKASSYQKEGLTFSTPPINGYEPQEFELFKEGYLKSIAATVEPVQIKNQKINDIINKELEKISLIEMNPTFLVSNRASEETKNNPVQKLSTDFSSNVVSAAFQSIGNGLTPGNLIISADKNVTEKDITSVSIKQIGEEYYAYLYANEKNVTPQGFRLPPGMQRQYQTILPIQQTNAMLDAMERIYAYRSKSNALVSPANPTVEIGARGDKWQIEIIQTDTFKLGRLGETNGERVEYNRNQLYQYLYGINPQSLEAQSLETTIQKINALFR